MQMIIEKTTPAKRQSLEVTTGSLPLIDGVIMVISRPTTRKKQIAAAKYLLDNMPPVAKKGEKTASQLLHEYRHN
jgi:hypothetical protein